MFLILLIKTLDFLSDQQPDYVVIEDIYSLDKYPGSGIMLGKVSGVLLVAAYKAGVKVEEISVKEAKKIILKGTGTHFDPDCVKAFTDSCDEILQIYERYKD